MDVLAKAAVRRHANAAWTSLGNATTLRVQKMALEYLHEVLQRQLRELLRACGHMKRQGLRKRTHAKNLLLLRNLLFSQIPRAPHTAGVALSLSQNAFLRMCREESLIIAHEIEEGEVASVVLLRSLLRDVTYAILLICLTENGPVVVTEDAMLAAVRHLRLRDVYNF